MEQFFRPLIVIHATQPPLPRGNVRTYPPWCQKCEAKSSGGKTGCFVASSGIAAAAQRAVSLTSVFRFSFLAVCYENPPAWKIVRAVWDEDRADFIEWATGLARVLRRLHIQLVLGYRSDCTECSLACTRLIYQLKIKKVSLQNVFRFDFSI